MAPDPERHKGELLKIPVIFPNEKEIFEGDPIPESFEYKEMMIRSIEFYPGHWFWQVVHRDQIGPAEGTGPERKNNEINRSE